MARMRGVGRGSGIALGTAAIVPSRNGFPQMPAIPPRLVELMAQRRLSEPPDVILVCDDYQSAVDIGSSLRWGRVVGIVTSGLAGEYAVSDLPAVTGVADGLSLIANDVLMLVDAERGVVVFDDDPESMDVMQYQAERVPVSPTRRLFLDEGHLPAATLDGRTVLTVAEIQTEDDLTLALEAGADALYVPFAVELLLDDPDHGETRQRLLSLLAAVGGKPLYLGDDYALPLPVLLEAAHLADLIVIEPPMTHLEGLGLGEFAEELNAAQSDALASGLTGTPPRLGAIIADVYDLFRADPDAETALIDRLVQLGATRLFLTFPLLNEHLAHLDNIGAACAVALLPVTLSTNAAQSLDFEAETDPSDAALRVLIGLGASGLLTAPTQIADLKARIAVLNFSECREALTQRLAAG